MIEFRPPPIKPIKLSADKNVRESTIEDDNRKHCNKKDVMFEKFVSPNKRSVPDRMLTFPLGLIAFIEYKAPGKFATDLQYNDHVKRRAKRCLVYVVDDKTVGRNLIDRLLQMESVKGAFAQELHNNKLNYTNASVVEK